MKRLLIVVHHRLDLWKVPAWFGERLRKEFAQLEFVQRDSVNGNMCHSDNMRWRHAIIDNRMAITCEPSGDCGVIIRQSSLLPRQSVRP